MGRMRSTSVFANLSQSASEYQGADGFEAPMAAHIVTAIK